MKCLLCDKAFEPPQNPNASPWAQRFCGLECSLIATMMVLEENPDLSQPPTEYIRITEKQIPPS